MRHLVYRQDVAPTCSEQLPVHGPAAVRQCATKERTGSQGQERKKRRRQNVGGGKDGIGNSDEHRYGNNDRNEATIERTVEKTVVTATYEMIVEVRWDTRESGRRQRVTSSRRRKTRRPSETVVSCGNQRPGTGSEGQIGKAGRGVKERKKRQMWKTQETRTEEGRTQTREC